ASLSPRLTTTAATPSVAQRLMSAFYQISDLRRTSELPLAQVPALPESMARRRYQRSAMARAISTAA
ncbi:MAG: hypothetical protein J0I75_19535, partial [Hyphomicrobium sp.]|nr:hypothetical protein [Hyphomicrobium sp.]